MTIGYLTKTELGHEDGVKHLDPAVKSALFQALYTDLIYNPGKDDGTTASFQEDLNQPDFSPTVQILELDTSATVHTNPSLKAIIMDDAGKDGTATQLNVAGGDNSIFVAMGNAGDTVRLFDSGNDTVYGGRGNDLIDASQSTGDDSLVGGGGNDTIWGGKGHDTLVGGAGRDELHSGSVSGGYNILRGEGGGDTLYGGAGADSLYGGAGHDLLVAGTGSGQLLQGNGGNDTLIGQQGDILKDTGSHNQFWLYNASDSLATSTLQGGAGNDTFHIETNIGNDTITGGGGHDVVYFDKQSYTDLSGPITKDPGGGYTLSFTNGQQISVSGISELHFSDNHTVTLK
jgi:Ca2+-binding RTX toxin-like protein